MAIWAATNHVGASFYLFNRADTSVRITDGHGEYLLLAGGAALMVAAIAALVIEAFRRLLQSTESGTDAR